MSDTIKDFYKIAGTRSLLLQKKISRFENNPDIAEEFEHWIEHRQYKKNGVEEQGYTAEKLASLSEYLDGEGAFDLLVELRENPEKGLDRISRGFKRK